MCCMASFHTAGDSFVDDYTDMLRIIKDLPTKPIVYVMVPPPLYPPFPYEMNRTVINDIFPTLIRSIAKDSGLEHNVIDVFDALGGKDLKDVSFTISSLTLDQPKLFCD